MGWTMEEALGYYRSQGAPGDQNVLIRLLREIQEESGGTIPAGFVREAAQYYGIKEGVLLALIKRIPSLRLGDIHILELCGGPNCGKHRDLADYAEKVKAASGSTIQLKYVPCQRLCGKGPNIRWDGTLYHRADKKLLDALTKGK